MKTPRHVITLISFFLIFNSAMAQEFEVPIVVSYNNADEYVQYEKHILKCIDWLEHTPVTTNPQKRAEASAFLLRWIEGSPYVFIELRDYLVDCTKNNPDLLVIFMAGWTKFTIENKDEMRNMLKGNMAGLSSLIKLYQANKGNGLKKDKHVEKIIAMDEKGELEKWIEEQIKPH